MSEVLKTLSGGLARGRKSLLADVHQAGEKAQGSSLPKRAAVFILLTASLGVTILASGIAHWQLSDPLRFACYLAVALLASGLKVTLPAIDGTMSVNFLFILFGPRAP